MPRKTSSESLDAFVREQDAATLATVLLELAEDHAAVRDRIARLQLSNNPKALTTAFRKTLTSWRRSTKFLGYAQAPEFGHELEGWLGQIERELMPVDPPAALALAEAFIEADGVFFERADDSDGVIGDAVRAGCRLWLKAASRCESPATEWPGKISALIAGDEYGAREELLRRADLLLSEEALRALVSSYEARLDAAPAQPGRGARQRRGTGRRRQPCPCYQRPCGIPMSWREPFSGAAHRRIPCRRSTLSAPTSNTTDLRVPCDGSKDPGRIWRVRVSA